MAKQIRPQNQQIAEALYKDDKVAKEIITSIRETKDHLIRGKRCKYIYSFMPQSAWINNPKHIIRYEKL